MSFDNLTRFVVHDGDDVSTDFAFTFPFQLKPDIVVTFIDTDGSREVLVLDVDYELIGEGSPNGGQVTLETELLTGQSLAIERIVPLTQPSDIDNLGEGYAEVIEDALDRQAMIAQQLDSATNRLPQYTVAPEAGLEWLNKIIAVRATEDGPTLIQVCLEQGVGVFAWETLESDESQTVIATDTIWDAKGDLVVGTGPNEAGVVGVGTNGQVLVADSGQTAGVKWATPASAGSVQTDAIFDAKGDLAVGTGPNTSAKLSVGSNGKVLTADSGEDTGAKWAVAQAAVVASTPSVEVRVLLNRTVLSGNSSGVTVTIPSGYDKIVIDVAGRVDNAGASSGLHYTFNSDNTDANYRAARMADSSTTQSNTSGDNRFGASLPGAGATANYFGQVHSEICNYDRTDQFKLISSHSALRTGASAEIVSSGCVQWESTAAITSILISSIGDNLVSGTVICVYGVKSQAVVTGTYGGLTITNGLITGAV